MSGVRAVMLGMPLAAIACVPHVVSLPAAERAEALGTYEVAFFRVVPPAGRWRAYSLSPDAQPRLGAPTDSGLLAGAHRFTGGLRGLLHDIRLSPLGGVRFCHMKRIVVEVPETGLRESDQGSCFSLAGYARVTSAQELSSDSSVVAGMRARVEGVEDSESYQTLLGGKRRHGRGMLREHQIAGRTFYEALVVSDQDSTRAVGKERGKILIHLDRTRILAIFLNADIQAGSPEWRTIESVTLLP